MNIPQTKKAVFILGSLVLMGLVYLIYNQLSSRVVWKKVSENTVGDVQNSFVYFSKLDGGGVLTKEEMSPAVVGIMIDNHSAARPQQIGLDEARVVYEAPVEGGITRFFALFNRDQDVVKVGPVRSARPYFLDWLREYGDALYMHSGGSPDALYKIKTAGIFDANEFYWGGYYKRDYRFEAPHNLFTSGSDWQKIFSENSADRKILDWEGWKFGKDESTATSTSLSVLKIKYSSNYIIEWKYSVASGTFARYLNGEQYQTNDDKPVNASTVIVQMVTEKILDDVGRLEIDTVGSGEARVSRDGKLIRGTWKKTSGSARTKFFDENDQEISLTPGQTWVQIVPQSGVVEITN